MNGKGHHAHRAHQFQFFPVRCHPRRQPAGVVFHKNRQQLGLPPLSGLCPLSRPARSCQWLIPARPPLPWQTLPPVSLPAAAVLPVQRRGLRLPLGCNRRRLPVPLVLSGRPVRPALPGCSAGSFGCFLVVMVSFPSVVVRLCVVFFLHIRPAAVRQPGQRLAAAGQRLTARPATATPRPLVWVLVLPVVRPVVEPCPVRLFPVLVPVGV